MKKVLALIAHDSKKDDMIQLVKAHQRKTGGPVPRSNGGPTRIITKTARKR